MMNEKVLEIVRAALRVVGKEDEFNYVVTVVAGQYRLSGETCVVCDRPPVKLRKVPLNRQLISSLWGVYHFLYRQGRTEFRRREVSQIIKEAYGETATANFGYLVYFGGLLYRPGGKQRGYWGMNRERAFRFFKGEMTLPAYVILNGHVVVEKGPEIAVSQVPSVAEFLDGNGDYQGWKVETDAL